MKLAFAIVLALASTARADTFENKATGAQRVHRLENIVWALTATCDKGDDTERRQCRLVRDARVAELQSASVLIDADADAFDAGVWNASSKSMPLQLTGCIRCAGVDVDGKTWFVTASGTSPRFEAGKLKTGLLHDNARSGFATEADAMKWTKSVSNARVQLVVKLPPKPRWTLDGKPGINLDVIAYRVIAPCDGSIVLASPGSGAVEADPKACVPEVAPPPPEPPKLDSLSTNDIQDVMKPVVQATQLCFEHFGVAGKAKLRMTVLGDGTIAKYEQQGDLVGTPTGDCIDRAVKQHAKFPRTKKAKSGFVYPIELH